VIRVAVDAMGSDRGPEEIVAGALAARSDTLEPIVFGEAEIDPHGLLHEPTTGVIEMHEKPAEAVRAKPDSSLVASIRAVAEGRADVCTIDCRSWHAAELHEPKAEKVQVVGWTGLRKGLPMITSLNTPPEIVEQLIEILSPP